MSKTKRKPIVYTAIALTILLLSALGAFFVRWMPQPKEADGAYSASANTYYVYEDQWIQNVASADGRLFWLRTDDRFPSLWTGGRPFLVRRLLGDAAFLSRADSLFALDRQTLIAGYADGIYRWKWQEGTAEELVRGVPLALREGDLYYAVWSEDRRDMEICRLSLSGGEAHTLGTVFSMKATVSVLGANDSGVWYNTLDEDRTPHNGYFPFADSEHPQQIPYREENSFLVTERRIVYLFEDCVILLDRETGEETEIRPWNAEELETGKITWAACASDTELYLSAYYNDGQPWHWPRLDLHRINGTYRYTFTTGEWKRVSGRVYSKLRQYDDTYLWGVRCSYVSFPGGDRLERIRVK